MSLLVSCDMILFMSLDVIFCADLEAREATRLLLLDERYKDKFKDELPQAVQVSTLVSSRDKYQDNGKELRSWDMC